MNRKLRYLVKWKDFGLEHNSWEPWDNLHAPDLVAKFHRKHPGAARRIRATEFASIPFQKTIVPRRHYLEGGVDVRGHSANLAPPSLSSADLALPLITSAELASPSSGKSLFDAGFLRIKGHFPGYLGSPGVP